ncbi:Gfo/Idh/MocA family protein [Metabacillus indicus]|uniref:Gfo/Idh/MocA family protein n=1 Tax=Metabacillus indicus TaxID=246786 RepID=UPI0039840239
MKIGVIGCGNISKVYLSSLKKFQHIEITGCADLVESAAAARSREFDIPCFKSPEELLQSDAEIILNLTIPKAHGKVALDSLNAGKHVYGEKPLAADLETAASILETAERKGLRVGCAPDTFLGGGIQTCKSIIDHGLIGEPVAATAFMMCRGHENWHPSPEFYYEEGGGPMFDMGPYYLTALIQLIGPMERVTGFSRKTFEKRTITSQPKYGKTIIVEADTHTAGVIQFSNGAIGTLVTSFDVHSTQLPHIEIYGTEGSIRVPNPNHFDGTILLNKGDGRLDETAAVQPEAANFRGAGLLDMIQAIEQDKPHRASGEMAFHVLETMHAFTLSSLEGKHIELSSTCISPLPLGEEDLKRMKKKG